MSVVGKVVGRRVVVVSAAATKLKYLSWASHGSLCVRYFAEQISPLLRCMRHTVYIRVLLAVRMVGQPERMCVV